MNRFETALERIKRHVEPQDDWSDADWNHYRTIIEALEIASERKNDKTDRSDIS
jgi:hypothetical protein